MKEAFTFEYANEIEFRKLEKSLKKYNMLAYKKLIFDYYPDIKNGKFLGQKLSMDQAINTSTYELKLPSSEVFIKVHGEVKLNYTVYYDQGIVLLNVITPTEILLEGHASELKTYKGILISNHNSQKDIFKINLLNIMN